MHLKDMPNPNDWVDGFITNVQNAINNGGQVTIRDTNGQDIIVAIEQGLLQFLIANRVRLAQVTLNIFQQFLDKMSKGQTFEALVLMYEQLDNSSLVQKYQEDSIKLAEIAKQTQADRDFWISFAKQAATKIVFSALGALI